MEEIKIGWLKFSELARGIARKIKRRKYNWDKYGLLGISRGGLPLLTFVANYLELQDVYTVQISATNSDKAGDKRDEPQIMHYDLGKKENFIVLDDVVSTGKSISRLYSYMLGLNRNLERVYCMFGDRDIERQTGVDIETEEWKDSNEWAVFCWEKYIN